MTKEKNFRGNQLNKKFFVKITQSIEILLDWWEQKMEREKPEHKKECRMYIDLDLTSARQRLRTKGLLDKFGTLDDIK